MKLYIGCGPSPIHDQHRDIIGDGRGWTFIDKYVHEPHIKNWDGTKLDEVNYNTVDEIYCSHTLEHFPWVDLQDILERWHDRLKPGGKMTINVPDLIWAARQFIKKENGGQLDGYFTEWSGEHGLLAILYGAQSHEGEYHKSGFTKQILHQLLQKSGYENIEVSQTFDAHEMGVLIATCNKPKDGGDIYAVGKKS